MNHNKLICLILSLIVLIFRIDSNAQPIAYAAEAHGNNAETIFTTKTVTQSEEKTTVDGNGVTYFGNDSFVTSKPIPREWKIRKSFDAYLNSRVVLANTILDGTNQWGVDFQQAEIACDRIAQQPAAISSLDKTSYFHLFPTRMIKMEGHLLSFGSDHEVASLTKLLQTAPKGSYWTGGRLVRYRVRNAMTKEEEDHIVLTWTDGRLGNAEILGITEAQKLDLIESYPYCLSLDIRNSSWQARDCNDLLSYACIITPKRFVLIKEAEITNSASVSISTESTHLATGHTETLGTTTTSPPMNSTDEMYISSEMGFNNDTNVEHPKTTQQTEDPAVTEKTNYVQTEKVNETVTSNESTETIQSTLIDE